MRSPDWVANKVERLARIRAAKAALEAEAEASSPEDDDDEGPGPSSGMGPRSGRPQRGADGGPPDRAQRNFTDPDSRIQPTRKGFIAGYNAQIAVDAGHQIIVAQRLQTTPADRGALKPLLADLRRDCRANPKEVSADSGYCSEANLSHLARRRIEAYVATGRAGHPGDDQREKGTRIAAMALKLRRAGRRSRYRLRKQIVSQCSARSNRPEAFANSC